MTNPIINTQNNNKCPHGMPQGTCPICNGSMGSGRSKDKNKPRVAGEMSYNECMAVWIRMQKAKQAKIQDRLDKIDAQNKISIEKSIEKARINLQNKIDAYFQKLDNVVKNLPPIIKTVILPAIKIIHSVLNVVVSFTFNVVSFIASVSEKMAMVLSEVKNHIQSFIQKTIDKAKKVIKTVLSLFMEFEENEEEDKQKIEEIIKNAVKKILKKDKEKEDELV